MCAELHHLEAALHNLQSGSTELTRFDRKRPPYPVRPKYRNPKNPAETWGDGRLPRWLRPQLRRGRKLDDFLVEQASDQKIKTGRRIEHRSRARECSWGTMEKGSRRRHLGGPRGCLDRFRRSILQLACLMDNRALAPITIAIVSALGRYDEMWTTGFGSAPLCFPSR
jgi:DNA-binding protein H-NS